MILHISAIFCPIFPFTGTAGSGVVIFAHQTFQICTAVGVVSGLWQVLIKR